MRLAGIHSMTVAPDLLRTLSTTDEPENSVADLSVFKEGPGLLEQDMKSLSFIDDETMYRKAFVESDGFRGPTKTAQVKTTFKTTSCALS